MTRAFATPRTKREKLDARESAIIRAAEEVVLELGVDGTTIAEIARRAGIAEGTLYLYFKNKQAIMRAVVREHWQALTHGTVEAVDGADDCFAQLEILARYHLDSLIEKWPVLELGLVTRVAGAKSDEQREFDYKRAYVVTFDEVFRRAQDRGEIRADVALWMGRDLFFGTLEYAARSMLLHPRENGVPDVVEFVMQVIRSGCGVDAPSAAAGGKSELTALTQRLGAVVTELEKLDQGQGQGSRGG